MEVYAGFKNTDSNLNTITDLIFSIKQSLSLALQRIQTTWVLNRRWIPQHYVVSHQIVIGIITLIMKVPIVLGVMHQVLAAILLLSVIKLKHEANYNTI